jgi:hypothetical protein
MRCWESEHGTRESFPGESIIIYKWYRKLQQTRTWFSGVSDETNDEE